MQHRGRLFAITLAVVNWGVSWAALADVPNPKEVYVRSISYGGRGCPQGSVGQSLSEDRTSLTLIFDEFVASVGPGVPVTEARKNCQISLDLFVPQGWQFSVADFEYRGYVQLPAGVTAAQQSLYYFPGEVQQGRGATAFVGPVAKDYLVRDPIALQSWSPCGGVRPLNINTQIMIIGSSTAPGQITMDSIDGKVRQILALQWRQC